MGLPPKNSVLGGILNIGLKETVLCMNLRIQSTKTLQKHAVCIRERMHVAECQ